MPYDRTVSRRQPAEDPELVAEREYNTLHGIPNKKDLKTHSDTELSDHQENNGAVPISPASSDSGNVSTASSLQKSNSFKEAKAERKKRNRGISGSSIKKDGGRFEHGFDSYDDEDLFTDDELKELGKIEIKDYSSDEPGEDKEKDSFDEDIEKLAEAFRKHLEMGSLGDSSNLVPLLAGAYCPREVIYQLGQAVVRVVGLDLKDHENFGMIAKDSCAEYKLSVMLAGILNELYTDIREDSKRYKDILKMMPLKEGSASAFVHMLIEAAITFIEYDADEIKGQIGGCPNEAIDTIISAMAGGWFDKDIYTEQCLDMEVFYVEIVKGAIVAAINSMDLEVIAHVEKAILNFASYAGEKFDCIYRLALVRVLANAPLHFDNNTTWPNVLRVLVAGVTENEGLWPYYSGPGRNWKLIPKATVTLASKPGDPHLQVLNEVPKNNIQLIKQI